MEFFKRENIEMIQDIATKTERMKALKAEPVACTINILQS
jgi:hypothetical protein